MVLMYYLVKIKIDTRQLASELDAIQKQCEGG